MTYNQSRYISIMKWRAKNIEKVNALNNGYKIKGEYNRKYWDKKNYYDYERECKRQRKINI